MSPASSSISKYLNLGMGHGDLHSAKPSYPFQILQPLETVNIMTPLQHPEWDLLCFLSFCLSFLFFLSFLFSFFFFFWGVGWELVNVERRSSPQNKQVKQRRRRSAFIMFRSNTARGGVFAWVFCRWRLSSLNSPGNFGASRLKPTLLLIYTNFIITIIAITVVSLLSLLCL